MKKNSDGKNKDKARGQHIKDDLQCGRKYHPRFINIPFTYRDGYIIGGNTSKSEVRQR